MSDTLDVQTCLVKGRFLHGAVDGRDEDSEPDGDPWTGLTVTIAATIAAVRNLRPEPATFITLDPFVLRTNSRGDMVAPDGTESVRVIACDDPMLIPNSNWYYVATITGDGFPTTRIPFYATATGIFDLIRDPQVPNDPNTALVEWQAAVTEFMTVKDQAMADLNTLLENFQGSEAAVVEIKRLIAEFEESGAGTTLTYDPETGLYTAD